MEALWQHCIFLLDIHWDELNVVSCCWYLPGGRWLISSITVNWVTKENHLHSHKWVSGSMRDGRCCHAHTDAAGSLWGGGPLEPHWEHSLCSFSGSHCGSPFTVFYVSMTVWVSSQVWLQQTAYMKTSKPESGGARGELCVMLLWDEASWLFLRPLNL